VNGHQGPAEQQRKLLEDRTELKDVSVHTVSAPTGWGAPQSDPGGAARVAYQLGETRNGSAPNHFLYSSFILPLCCNR